MKGRRGSFEIVVAGAGPVGLLFAFRLARRSSQALTLRVLDAAKPRVWQAEEMDPRVYALSRESQQLLMDCWPEIAARRVSAYRRMCVFENTWPETQAAVTFDAADIGEPDLGHIVEDNLLRTVLLERLQMLGIEITFGVGVEGLARQGGRARIALDNGESIDADLIVGADGANSAVRQVAGIDVVRKDYAQRAIVAHVTSEKPHARTAWQRFLPGGPLALLPLADGRSSIVWTTDDADAERLLALPDSEFLGELQDASADVLGRLGPCSRRHSFPLAFKHAVRYTRPGIALIGDAAHAVHPLAGQGMNLGMRDAAILAETVSTALAGGEYAGDEFVLRRYSRAQRGHNLAMQLAFDGINELYRGSWPDWMASLRGFGMAAVDRISPAKRLLMRRALGIDAAAGTGGPDSSR